MDFDKIKQAAKDTFKIVNSKANNTSASPRPRTAAEDDFDDFSADDEFMGQTRRFDMKDALNRVKQNTDSIKNSVAELISREENSHQDNTSPADTLKLGDVNSEIEALRESIDVLEEHIVIIERKLTDVSKSISGVNKINDSIFDLKNSQINTRNSISELELSFKQMKKKTISGITVTSIITAVVAVLEIINLLS